jgi:tetratricopeptide (TPR) repeat protein
MAALSAIVCAQEAPAEPVSPVQAALESAAVLLQSGHPRAALEALEPVEEAEPDNPWLDFYKGSAQLQLGAPYAALEAYDRALKRLAELGDPDPELAERIRTHRHRARRQVFGISLQTGLAYDTNVTYLGGGSTALGLIAGRDDGRFSSGFNLHYSPVATEEETFTMAVRLGHSWHFAVEQFNFQDYGASFRYARRFGPRWEADLQYDYDFTLLGNEPFLCLHTLTPGLTYTWQPVDRALRFDRTRLFYRFEERDYRFETEPEFDRDGPGNGFGLVQSFKLRPVPAWAWTWDLAAGYNFHYFGTDGSEFDAFSHVFSAALDMPLVNPSKPETYLILPDRELLFHFTASWQIDDYRRRSLIDKDGDPRSDYITTLGWGLSQTLLQDRRYGELILHGLINWTDASSNVTARRNVSPFTYDKVVYAVQLEWSW